MKKRVKFMVTLLLLSAMVLVPVSAFAASDRCSSCNSNNYNISCNASGNDIDDSVSRSDCNADYSTTCNNITRLNNATYNCSGNSTPQKMCIRDRLVAAITIIPSLLEKPSISTNNWFNVCSLSSWPPPKPAPR